MKGSESRREGVERDGISCVSPPPNELHYALGGRDENERVGKDSERLRGYFEAETKERNHEERAHG